MGLNYTAVDQDPETTLLRARAGHCLIAERDGELIATLTMSLPPSAGLQELTASGREPHRAWLNQMAVSPAARGQGLSAYLWREGLRWANNQGARSVGVDTAVPATHLVRLYERWGFRLVDTIHWPGKSYDSVVMVRAITPADA